MRWEMKCNYFLNTATSVNSFRISGGVCVNLVYLLEYAQSLVENAFQNS